MSVSHKQALDNLELQIGDYVGYKHFAGYGRVVGIGYVYSDSDFYRVTTERISPSNSKKVSAMFLNVDLIKLDEEESVIAALSLL